jgi:ABC-type nitrate/sulfonate/bicarbonate transport system substrate-binding protein
VIVSPRCPALFVLVAALFATVPVDARPRKVNVSIAANSALYAPYFIASDKGYYAIEGLDINFVEASGGVATPALLSGSIDISTSSASALSAAMRGGHLKIIYTMADRLPHQLWATRPELKTLKDLKGLTVGIASRGDTYEIALRTALEDAGLPQDWLGYTPLGFAPSVRLSALISGSLPAVMITPVDVAPGLASGSLTKSHLMIDFVKSLQLPYTGAAVSDQLLKSDPAMIEGFLRATVKGVRYALAFEPQAVAALQKRNPQTDVHSIIEEYRETVPTMTKVGTASDDLIRSDLKVRAAVLDMNPNDIRPINEIYDYMLTRKVTAELDGSGWKPTP